MYILPAYDIKNHRKKKYSYYSGLMKYCYYLYLALDCLFGD